MSDPKDARQDDAQENELDLETETVKDLDVDEAGAEQVAGGAVSLLTKST